jgi:hypothetical protein
MAEPRAKPQGAVGALHIGPNGATWEVICFPEKKSVREQLLADLFVQGSAGYIASQSEPSLAPFGPPKQNAERDLDFTVETAKGSMLLELAEFAPLADYGPKFCHAPNALDPKVKAPLAVDLILKKSRHQGGPNRFLIIYSTEYAFKLDIVSIERIRRLLREEDVQFERIYYISIHNLSAASVSEVYPGTPHRFLGTKSDLELDDISVMLPHPSEFFGGT